MSNDEEALRGEAEKILDRTLRSFALSCLDRAPDYFWTKPSSSSGKYHPPDEHGEGGLVLHTSRVVKLSEILLKSAVPPVMVDSVRFAAIFHDVGRFGFEANPAEHSLKDHPELASKWLEEQVAHFLSKDRIRDPIFRMELNVAQRAIESHMGKWGGNPPSSKEDWIVHSADMVASQYF